MPGINIVVITLLVVTSLSIVVSVAAWFYLTSIGSKISILERETEKRSAEFDTLRRNYATVQHSSTPATVIEESESTINSDTPSMQETIQIFRNVRGSFEDAEASPSNTSNYEVSQQPVEANAHHHSDQESIAPAEQSEQYRESLPPEVPPPPPTTFDQIGIVTPAAETDQEKIVLPLYSDSTKDADFQTLWSNITQILQQQQSPNIAIDFSNINFLYEKELDYLVKINYLIAKQGGTLHLVNCDRDLLTLINRNQQLGSIVLL